jgi:hypothetical protein
MSRGYGWWGTPTLVVGAIGLLLLSIGAKGMQDDDAINESARQEAERVEADLNDAEHRQDAVAILLQEEMTLKARGRTVELRSLAPKKGQEMKPEQAAEARQRIYDAQSIQSDPGAALPLRIAFYTGLILVFTAGVLLYRRTPASVRGTW